MRENSRRTRIIKKENVSIMPHHKRGESTMLTNRLNNKGSMKGESENFPGTPGKETCLVTEAGRNEEHGIVLCRT